MSVPLTQALEVQWSRSQMPTSRKAINWNNVLLTAALAATASAALIYVPVIAHGLRAAAEERAETLSSAIALDDAGFISCRHEYAREARLAIDRSLPGPFQVSVVVSPSWGARQWGIRIARGEVYFVQLNSAWPPAPPPEPGETDRIDLPASAVVHHAPISAALADDLATLFETRASKATDDQLVGLDGVTYQLYAGPYCALAWSPDPGTGAGRLVKILDLLADHSQLAGASALSDSERKIQSIVRTFHSSPRAL